jgi:hypothetical protein
MIRLSVASLVTRAVPTTRLLAFVLSCGTASIGVAQENPPLNAPNAPNEANDFGGVQNSLPQIRKKSDKAHTTTKGRAVQQSHLPLVDIPQNRDVQRWIEDLASPAIATRDAATKSLIQAGSRIAPTLRGALSSDDREVRMRAELVAIVLERKAITRFNGRDGISLHDRTGYARSLTIRTSELSADDVQCLPSLFRLEYLHVYSSAVQDSWLAHIGQLSSLRNLSLKCPNVTDAGIAHLTELPALDTLVVLDGKIKGWGVGELAGNHSLRTLSLSDLPLEDQSFSRGIRKFARTRLRSLGVIRCPISNRSLVAIANIESLTTLSVSATNLTDAGLKDLSSLPRLKRLHLSSTRISDVGVVELLSFPALTEVTLSGTDVTVKGCARLGDVKQLELLNLAVHQFPVDEAAVSNLKCNRWARFPRRKLQRECESRGMRGDDR